MTIRQHPDADRMLDEIARLVRAGDPAGARKLCEQALAWIAESQHPCLWHYGGANEHSAGDPRYLKYAAP